MKTLATTFSGGGGFEAGAILAGLTPIWGVEYDPEIAGVYASNYGPHCIVSKVEDVDYSTLQTPFHYHTSPSCVRASQTNQDRGETAEDIAAAEGVARSIRILKAPNFSLENVWAYREFESFKIICRALEESGYNFKFWHLNAADYGVPQTRKRLILLASRTHRPQKPAATHSQRGPSAQVDLFGSEPLKKWVGWYEAIEDLIPTLPESKFAEWQLKRMKDSSFTFLSQTNGAMNLQDNELRQYGADEPCFTLRTMDGRQDIARAFIMDDQRDGFNDGVRTRDASEPIFALTTRPAGKSRAFIIPGDNSSSARALTVDEPFVTLQTRPLSQCPHKAFICDSQNGGNPDSVQTRDESEPSFTVTANMGERSRHPRAWLQHGRVVAMTPRALARFQSIPDSYVLPEKNGLACKVIGNAVASLLARRIVESLMGTALLNTEAAA